MHCMSVRGLQIEEKTISRLTHALCLKIPACSLVPSNQFKFSKSYPPPLTPPAPAGSPQDKASLQATVERLTVDIGVLRSDNMNLFEKIKFLEAFHRSNGGGGAAGGATGVTKVWQR